jgi:hypothetical protein
MEWMMGAGGFCVGEADRGVVAMSSGHRTSAAERRRSRAESARKMWMAEGSCSRAVLALCSTEGEASS